MMRFMAILLMDIVLIVLLIALPGLFSTATGFTAVGLAIFSHIQTFLFFYDIQKTRVLVWIFCWDPTKTKSGKACMTNSAI